MSEFTLIDVEYESYAVIHFCHKKWYGLFTTDNFIILSRDATGSNEFIDEKLEFIKE